jgi:hypothetical protein|tara:strand:- start:159 stop:521 length:363 start_codon:yes stop_codon:yes gene_type:complete
MNKNSAIGASVHEVLAHLKTNKPSVCAFCKKDQGTVEWMRVHIHQCWTSRTTNAMTKGKPLEDWVSDITIAHNNHAKAIEVLELRERSLKETESALSAEIADLRKAVNTLLTHLELTLEG